MSDKIEASDILGPDATAKMNAFNESLHETTGLLNELQTVMKSMQMRPFTDSKSIQEFNKDQVKSIELINRAEAAKIRSQNLAIAAVKAVEAELKANEKAAAAQAKLNSEYEQANAALTKLSKRQMDNSIAGREMSKTAKLVADAHADLKVKVEKAEQSVGRFQRNVGNYKSGFNGLQNSINQLTREFPAFTNSVQTGFMALSNNIPMFFDEIKKVNAEIRTLREQGEQTPGLFSRLTSSLFSWGTALSLGITVLTVFGKEIGNFISDLFKQDQALKLSKEGMTEYYNAIRQKQAEYVKSMLQRRVLEGQVTQERADLMQKEFDQQQKLLANEQRVGDELIRQSKEWGVKIEDIFDFNERRIKMLPESIKQIVAQTGETIDIQLKENIKRNEKLRELQNQLNEQNKIDAKTFENDNFIIRTEAFNKLLEEKKKNRDGAKKEEDSWWEQYLKDWEGKYEQLLKIYDADADAFLSAQKRKFDETKKRGEDNTSLIIQNMALEASIKNDSKLKEEARYQAELNMFKIQYDEKGKITEESDKHLELLRQQHKQNLEAIENDADEKAQEKRKKAAEEEKKRRQEEIDNTMLFVEKSVNANNDMIEQQLNNELDMRQRNIEQQQQLAIAGKANTLAFEKAEAVKAEKEQQELAKREYKQQEAIAYAKAYLSALNAQMAISATDPKNNPPNQAAIKALGDVLLAKAVSGVIAGSFIEGTENVEQDLKGNKVHNGRDGYVIAVDGKERILNPAQNAMIGDLSNDELAKIARDYNEGFLPKYITNVDAGSFAENTTNSMLLHQFSKMNNKMSSIEKALKERPVSQTNIDNMGNVITTQIVNGLKKQTTKKNNSPLNYV